MDTLREAVEQLRETNAIAVRLLEGLQNQGTQTQTITQTIGGFATGIAVTACVATLMLMLGFMVIENRSYAHLDAQVDQLRAWNDVHSKEIARLQAALQEKR